MLDLVECLYCRQPINLEKMRKESDVFACPRCGGPLPASVVPWIPQEIDKVWKIKIWYSDSTQTVNLSASNGTGEASYNHVVPLSVMYGALMDEKDLVTIGYSPGEQPTKGDISYDPRSAELSLFVGNHWVGFNTVSGLDVGP